MLKAYVCYRNVVCVCVCVCVKYNELHGVERPSRETANCAATQELPRILCNLKIHCRITRALHWSLS
jgi:hypothetical protein